MRHFFIRVSGPTLHDDPKKLDCYVDVEPTAFKKKTYSNYLSYCFENDIVRFGWPDVGDLQKGNRWGAKANCYDLATIPSHIRRYLEEFVNIQPGSILVIPDRDISGEIYVCKVVKPYWYDASGPYECAHRVGVRWDRDNEGRPILYTNEQLGIPKGGWWRKAFQEIKDPKITTQITLVRERNL